MRYLFLIGQLLILFAGCKARYLRFDRDTPGQSPKVFGRNLIAPDDEHTGYCAFSPDGSEFYYSITNDDWAMSRIIRIAASNLKRKDTLFLINGNYEGEPFVTKDGRTMYFMAVLPPAEGQRWHSDLYRVKRMGKAWGNPEKLNSVINSRGSEWHVSVTSKGVMYFTSEREKGTSALHGDIYRAQIRNDTFINLEKLPYPVNTDFNDSDPLIAPDESFLIFHSDRPGGFGQHDLYISFRKNGKWSDPVNMGKNINSEGWEMAPSLTPDGKYLLYTWRKAMVTSEPARIYWVSTAILKNYIQKDERPNNEKH